MALTFRRLHPRFAAAADPIDLRGLAPPAA